MNNFSNFPICRIFIIFLILGSKMGSPRVGRCLKSFLEVMRFFVIEYRAVGNQGDPICNQNYDFGRKIWQSYGRHLGGLGSQRCPQSGLRGLRLKKVSHFSAKINIFMKKY